MGKGRGFKAPKAPKISNPLSGLKNITQPGKDPMSLLFGGDVTGVEDQAKYAQAAAEAEQNQRRAVTAEARASRDRLLAAAQSPQQMQALEQGLRAAQTQVDTDLRQLAAIDPAIMEASKQVLGILQGKTADVNNPAMAQRAAQRQTLLNSLRSQYGPGAESSSLGQKALRAFDMETDNMFQANQQNTLGNLFGMATTRVSGPGFGQLMAAGQGFGDYQNRILGATQAGDTGVLQAMSGEVQGAGAQFVGNLIKAGAQRQVAQGISEDGRQIGRSWATFGQGGGKGQKGPGSGDLSSGNKMGSTYMSPQFGGSQGGYSQFATNDYGF